MGLERGVTGVVNHTVPAALLCWLSQRGSYRDAVEEAVALGGDTDTVAAIVGALAGAELGVGAIPEEWIQGIAEWPCTVDWISQLSRTLSQGIDVPTELPVMALLARNAAFGLVVLCHGGRRLLPPY